MMSKPLATLLTNPGLPVMLVLLLGSIGYLYFRGPDKRLDRFLVAVSLALPAHALAMFGARLATFARPQKLDLYVYWLDGLSGFQPSFALGRLIDGRLSMMMPLTVAYELLPFAIVAVFGGYLWLQPEREAMRMVPVFLLNLALSVPFYLLFPVCGPAYAFPGYPALPSGPVVPHPIPLNAPPNGVPSIHFSTALLIYWYARKLPFGRWIGGIYLLLTAAATMGSGEHYLWDLLVAVPYAIAVYRLGGVITRHRLAAVGLPTLNYSAGRSAALRMEAIEAAAGLVESDLTRRE